MNDFKKQGKWDILDKVYNARQKDFEKDANKEREELAKKLNHVTVQNITIMIEKNGEDQEKILSQLNQLIENYEIKMAYYAEKRYKQGFKDGICLLKQCEYK